MRVAVVGASGMLGRAVLAELQSSNRGDGSARAAPALEAFPYDPRRLALFPGFADVVVNCAGEVWQRKPGHLKMYQSNVLLPGLLGCFAPVVHISTDCVFSGDPNKMRGNYTERDVPDPTDWYGETKLLGEDKRAMVLRLSAVGHGNGYSLLDWAVSQRGQRVTGYTDHLWNGLTAPKLGLAIKQILTDDMFAPGVFHLHASSTVSKAKLLHLFNDRYDLKLDIDQQPSPSGPCNRVLASSVALCSRLNIPSVEEMVASLPDLRVIQAAS